MEDSSTPHAKRSMNSFMIFSNAERSSVVASGLSRPAAVTKELGRRWRALSDEEKRPYVDEAKRLKAQLQKDYSDDQETGGSSIEKYEQNSGPCESSASYKVPSKSLKTRTVKMPTNGYGVLTRATLAPIFLSRISEDISSPRPRLSREIPEFTAKLDKIIMIISDGIRQFEGQNERIKQICIDLEEYSHLIPAYASVMAFNDVCCSLITNLELKHTLLTDSKSQLGDVESDSKRSCSSEVPRINMSIRHNRQEYKETTKFPTKSSTDRHSQALICVKTTHREIWEAVQDLHNLKNLLRVQLSSVQFYISTNSPKVHEEVKQVKSLVSQVKDRLKAAINFITNIIQEVKSKTSNKLPSRGVKRKVEEDDYSTELLDSKNCPKRFKRADTKNGQQPQVDDETQIRALVSEMLGRLEYDPDKRSNTNRMAAENEKSDMSESEAEDQDSTDSEQEESEYEDLDYYEW